MKSKRRKFGQWLCYTGIWMIPVAQAVLYATYVHFGLAYPETIRERFALFLLCCLPSLYTFSNNSVMKANGKRYFELLDAFRGIPEEYSSSGNRRRAMYPVVEETMLYAEPEGIVFGKYKGRYVCKPIGEAGHVMIVGGSGSGKTSGILLPALIVNSASEKRYRVWALDIKGELSAKGEDIYDPDSKVMIFNPRDRKTAGYDPFFELDDSSTEQDVLRTVSMIATYLIPLSASEKDPFWKESGRNLFTGLSLYYYSQGYHNLIDIVDQILARPVQGAVQEIMQTAEESENARKYVNAFGEMDEKTLGSIFSQVTNPIMKFSTDQDLRYALRDNPVKASPKKLEEGWSIYISVKEEELSVLVDLVRLCVDQELNYLCKRPENSEPVLMAIDECSRILSAGKIGIVDAAKTLRSRKVTLLVIAQSIEGFQEAFEHHQVTDFISNLSYKVILDSSSSSTMKEIIGWCGKYTEKKTSWSGSGANRKQSISFEEKDIVRNSDLITGLVNTAELILISTKGGYNRFKKCPYYKDPYLRRIADRIAEKNSMQEKL